MCLLTYLPSHRYPSSQRPMITRYEKPKVLIRYVRGERARPCGCIALCVFKYQSFLESPRLAWPVNSQSKDLWGLSSIILIRVMVLAIIITHNIRERLCSVSNGVESALIERMNPALVGSCITAYDIHRCWSTTSVSHTEQQSDINKGAYKRKEKRSQSERPPVSCFCFSSVTLGS